MSGRLPRLPGVVATVDKAGEGGFWGSLVFHPQVVFTDVILSSVVNQVKTMQFVLPFRAVVGSISWRVITLEVGKFIGSGIYDAGKNILLQGKVLTTTTGVKTVTITSVTLEPGVYWHAWTADGIVVKARHVSIGQNYRDTFNENVVKWGSAANASTTGVLPATLGTITPAGPVPMATYFSP